MLIQRGQLITGRPAVELRELMRAMRWTAFSVAGLAEARGMTVGEATDLVTDLRAAGLIDVAESHSGRYVIGRDEVIGPGVRPLMLTTTIAGNALAKARIGRPMARSDARKLCEGVIARAEAVNQSNAWLHWVIEVGVYGSYAASGDGPVGDVDLVVHLQRRYGDDDYERLNDDMIDADDAHPQTFLESLGYAEVKLLRHLRGRSPRVDLLQGGPRGSGVPPEVTPISLYTFVSPR